VQGAVPEAVVGIEDADWSVISIPSNVLVTRHLHSTSSIRAKRATLFVSNQLMQLLLLNLMYISTCACASWKLPSVKTITGIAANLEIQHDV